MEALRETCTEEALAAATAELAAAKAEAAEADTKAVVLKQAIEARERYEKNGFGIEVLIEPGRAIALSSDLSYEQTREEVLTLVKDRYSEAFYLCCKALPSGEESMETEETDPFVYISDNEHFEDMKRQYYEASSTAFPIVVLDPIDDERKALLGMLVAVKQLTNESLSSRDIRRALHMAHNIHELLSRKAWSMEELRSRTTIVSGNDPTENADAILPGPVG